MSSISMTRMQVAAAGRAGKLCILAWPITADIISKGFIYRCASSRFTPDASVL